MVTLKQLKVGSVVMVRTNFGTGHPVKATVVEVEDDIKNGRPGIDYVTVAGDESWAYLSQVDRVIA